MDKPWKVIFAFVGVFVAGSVFGGLLALRIGRALTERRFEQRSQPQPAVNMGQPQPPQQPRPLLPVPPALQTVQLLRRFAERLELTPEQRDRLMPLFQRATGDFRRQQQTFFREDSVILQRLQEDIKKELRPDQRAKLEKMEERQRVIIEQRQRDERQARSEPAGGPNNQRPNANNAPFNPNQNQRNPNLSPRPGQPGPFPQNAPNGPPPGGPSNPRQPPPGLPPPPANPPPTPTGGPK